MGLTYANIRVENPFNHRGFDTSALVDSGAVFLTIPEHNRGHSTTKHGRHIRNGTNN